MKYFYLAAKMKNNSITEYIQNNNYVRCESEI